MNRDQLLSKYANPTAVLDFGHIRLVDCMGGDERIEAVARLSYQMGTRKVSETRGLLRYLFSHRHCYHPSMEVLTADGWKRWADCEDVETFLVPDPTTRTLKREVLQLEIFDADEEMISFENDRMSFCVTPDHRMWFAPKFKSEFQIQTAEKMPRWASHFDPLAGYELVPRLGSKSPLFQFVGFLLGDGSWHGRQVSFHLKKDRKKKFLIDVCEKLGWTLKSRKSATYEDATVYTVDVLDEWSNVSDFVKVGARAAEKSLLVSAASLKDDEIRGLLDGLVNSDGSLKADRPQTQYSSVSPELRRLFMTLNAYVGVDAHEAGTPWNVSAHDGDRTTLESRGTYWSRIPYEGKVCCTTSSTGLLMVRGAADKFAFVCGNTSPFEQAVITLDMKMPIFVARQLVRHRTQSLNELSGRYSELPEEFYVPEPAQVCYQSDANRQGRSGPFPLVEADQLRGQMREEAEDAFVTYRQFLEAGMSKETARMGLPLSTYTQWCTTMNLHNLLHMLGLRMDEHAQWETRQFANAIWEIVQDWCPITAEAFTDFQLEAETFSRMDLAMLRDIVQDWKSMQDDLCESDRRDPKVHMDGLLAKMFDRHEIGGKRERMALLEKLGLA